MEVRFSGASDPAAGARRAADRPNEVQGFGPGKERLLMFRGTTAMWTMVAILAWAGAVAAAPRQIPTVQISAEGQIAAPPVAVWAYMTSGKNAAAWCPEWKSPSNGSVKLEKVGDVLDFTDQWGNKGRSIVTYIMKDRELRVANEPDDGSYMCQTKLVLTSDPGGTKIRYDEQYTDASAPESLKTTAAQVETEMQKTLAALKKAVEKKN